MQHGIEHQGIGTAPAFVIVRSMIANRNCTRRTPPELDAPRERWYSEHAISGKEAVTTGRTANSRSRDHHVVAFPDDGQVARVLLEYVTDAPD